MRESGNPLRHHFITGVAGFVGSHLADRLLQQGHAVSGVDDFSLGTPGHLERLRQHPKFLFVERDISDVDGALECLRAAAGRFEPPDVIWHLAANSDIAAGVADPGVDFRKTLQTTFAMIEAARDLGVKQIALASTSAVYGERDGLLSEDSGPLLPISTYGANKLASEALLSAAAESSLERIWIFRFPNVVGPRPTHGALLDFLRQLASGAKTLRVLGDGSQTKPFLHVTELLGAMLFIVGNSRERRNVFNIGPDSAGTTVAFMAERLIERVRPGTPIVFTGGDRGWVGDVPRFAYSTERLARLGWRPTLSSDAAVMRAIDEIGAVFAL